MEEGWGKIQKWNIVINGENKRDEFKERRNTKIPTKCREAKACFEWKSTRVGDEGNDTWGWEGASRYWKKCVAQ